MGKTVFDLVKGKIKFLSISSFLAFKEIKASIPPWRRLQIFVLPFFRVTCIFL